MNMKCHPKSVYDEYCEKYRKNTLKKFKILFYLFFFFN